MAINYDFSNNKYTTVYLKIIASAQNRDLTCYSEEHHIIPKSLGGSNISDNLILLTAREHFICHWLLTKMTNGNARHKMLSALLMMRAEKFGQHRYFTKITSRVYARCKTEYSTVVGDRMRKLHAGKKKSPASIARRAAANTGKKRSIEFCKQMSDLNKGKNTGPMSEDTKQKISASNKGKQKPYGFGDKVSTALLGKEKSMAHRENIRASINRYYEFRKLDKGNIK